MAAITGFRTGHGYFKSYLHEFVPAKYLDNKCRCRLRPPQTVQHLILRCSLLTKKRNIMRRKVNTELKALRLQTLLFTSSSSCLLLIPWHSSPNHSTWPPLY